MRLATLPAVVVNPAQVRHFAFAVGKRVKTDPIDAELIAQFVTATNPEVRPLPDEETRALADLVTRRRQIIQDDNCREAAREAGAEADAEEHRPPAQGAREGALQSRPGRRGPRLHASWCARQNASP